MDDIVYQGEEVSRSRRTRGSLWQRILNSFDGLVDALEDDWAIILREADLFFGILLLVLGIFHFHTGKFCDGNAADYLSCTRPAPYHFYTWLEMLVIFLGVTFVLLWFMKRNRS